MKGLTKFFLAAFAAGTIQFSLGATGEFNITRLLVQPGVYGGCAVAVTPSPSEADPTCGINWFTAGCDGENGRTKAEASKTWELLQLAYVTNQSIFATFNGRNTANGKCMITRLDLIKPSN
jgi:hypothetical protein